MDSNNWGPNQGTEPTMDTSGWRAELPPDSRQRIVNKIMDTLKKHLPISGPDGLVELQKIAQRFEEKIFSAATSQTDYLRKISMKMLAMETKSQSTMTNNRPSNQVGPSNNPPDQGLALQPQVHIAGQQHPITLPNQQPQLHQQLLSQNIQNSTALQPNLPPVSNLAQIPSQNIGQNSTIQNLPAQNSVGSTIGQNSNVQDMFPGSQRQMPGRQQVVPQQQQQQSQNSQQYLNRQQLMNRNLQLQSQIQQQQQPNLLQPNQLQPSMMQTSLSSLQQNQQPNNVQQSSQSMLQQHSQVIRQQQQQQSSITNQQQSSMTQQPMLSVQQQQQPQQLMGLQSNATSMQHAQMLGPQNNVGDIQQPQRLLSQQTNLTNMQQRQQQQLLNQQSNLANMHQQQLGSGVTGLRQQQLVGPEAGSSGMQTSQQSAHMLQQTKVPMQQQSQQNASLLPSQAQQSQPQGAQQQSMPQVHSQPAQLQQQPNPLQRDMQQRLQASGLIQQQHVLDHQKQIYQSQRALPETSASSLDSAVQTAQPSGGDEQEEVYQKIKTMKESYLPELSETYQRISARLQQYESHPHQTKLEQLDKLKIYKTMLEKSIAFLQVSKSSIPANFKEKLGAYEKQIIHLINLDRARKEMSSMRLGQLPPPHGHSMLQPQSQVAQVQSHENQINSQLQPSNLPGCVATMQQNNIASLRHNSMSGVSAGQQNMMNSMQPGANLDSGQGDSMNSMKQIPMSSLQQSPASTPQQTNVSPISSQGGVNVVQQNLNTLQSGSSMLQNQQLKHQQEQQMLQNQQFKQQYQQRPFMQRQQILQQQQQQQQQQLHQPAKQQLSAMQTHQTPQLHQTNDINDMKMRQGMGIKTGILQQHLTSGQHSAYSHQQSKQGGPYLVSSPQLLQAASPQIPQHSSPQVEQQNHLPSLTKVATPLQSSNSPFVGPTPSPPLAPSPMPGDSEKPISGVSSISKAASIGHQMGAIAAPAQSLAIGTPGISASPLLAEYSAPDGAPGNALADTSGRSTVAEQPIERLIRVLKSMSPKTLSGAVSDIGSVVSMNDRIAGSAPANGCKAAIGEDLVSMTNCRLQARNFITQDSNSVKRMKRYMSAIPLNVASSAGGMNDSINQLTASEASDMDSTATSSIKKPTIEVNHTLLEEIRELNNRLIDTVIDIIDEDIDPAAAAAAAAEGAEGTIVKCSYKAVALSPSLKFQYAQMSPIQPLRLLVPANYPNCSPIFLDKFPVECSEETEDLSMKARSKFSISLRCLTQPMSLKEIARTWDKCARGAVSEYAQGSGGGTFSSKFGTWDDVL